MTVFVALTALDGTSVRVSPASVAIVTPVPAELLPGGVLDGSYLRTLADDVVAVQSSVSSLQDELGADGEASFALVLRAGDGADCLANPALVSHLEPVPPALLPAGETDAVYVRSGARNVQLVVRGTVAAVQATLEAAAPVTSDDVIAYGQVSNAGPGTVGWIGTPVGFVGDPIYLAAGEVEMELSGLSLDDSDWSVSVTSLDQGFSVEAMYTFTPPNLVRAVLRSGSTGFDGNFAVIVIRRPSQAG